MKYVLQGKFWVFFSIKYSVIKKSSFFGDHECHPNLFSYYQDILTSDKMVAKNDIQPHSSHRLKTFMNSYVNVSTA